MLTHSISLHSTGLSQTNHSQFACILEKHVFYAVHITEKSSKFQWIFIGVHIQTTNALFRFKAPLHIVMHKHALMDHQTLNLNMSIGYGAYHNLDGLLGIYTYYTFRHIQAWKIDG